jgi:hypothetical protein
MRTIPHKKRVCNHAVVAPSLQGKRHTIRRDSAEAAANSPGDYRQIDTRAVDFQQLIYFCECPIALPRLTSPLSMRRLKPHWGFMQTQALKIIAAPSLP